MAQDTPSIGFGPHEDTKTELLELIKRVNIPINSTTPPALEEAITHDPFSKAGKYGLIFVYFGIILLVLTTIVRLYNYWGDKIRTALYKEDVINSANSLSPSPQYDGQDPPTSMTDGSTRHFFPSKGPLLPEKSKQQASVSTIAPINNTIALFRWIFYRPVPTLKFAGFHLTFPSLGVILIVVLALIASMLYCFLPKPLFYTTLAYGSPPLAVRAGMMSVALMPWVVILASKANLVSYITGIGHERLIVLHRWTAYLCIIFAIIHAVPYWYQSVRNPEGFATFKLYFNQRYYVFTTGICAFAPLLFLTLHSLPILRTKFYEAFALLHIPVAWAFVGLLFWHCNNYLSSWSYLYATVVLLVISLLLRLLYLNWMNPFRASWLIGEESAVTILPENAIKVTIPTQKKWLPGQHVYLRMPGVSLFENHPFTIASLCSEDFPSEYGEQYRDMTLVFRPFGGFTRKLYTTAMKKGPYKTYRAFIEGPYGGMQRQMASFDQVIFFAGGSGITAIASQLLDLIKRMRDGKATTQHVHVIWAMKRPEIMEWFKEELRICRECAPPGSVQCSFFITAAKPIETRAPEPQEPLFSGFKEKINDALQGVASKRNSMLMFDQESGYRYEKDEEITALPQLHLAPPPSSIYFTPPQSKRSSMHLQAPKEPITQFDFGFPRTPTQFQRDLMRFAVLPTHPRKDGWRTEYGRPDIPSMLKSLSKDFGRRTCVYVCGPPDMRTDVANTVAKLQQDVWSDPGRDEIFLHAENYAI